LLLFWVPWLGLLLAVGAIVCGILSLVRKQSIGFTVTGLLLGMVALVLGFVMTVGFSIYGSDPSAAEERPAPAATTPAPEDPEDEESEEATAPEPTPQQELATPDLATFEPADDRTFALLAKDPDSHMGTNLVVYGEVSQLDSATGPCAMLLSVAASQQEYSYDYEQNSLAMSGDGELACPVFEPLVEGDHVKAWVTVLGSVSYDTQIGGNTTVPAFQVWQAELLPAQEY